MIRDLRNSPEGSTAEVKSHNPKLPDTWYRVVRSSENAYRCTCPRNFIKQIECKHIDEVRSEIARLDFVHEWGEACLYFVVFTVPYLSTIGYTRHKALVTAKTTIEARARVKAAFTNVTIERVTSSGSGIYILP